MEWVDSMAFLAIDMGGTKTLAARSDLTGKILSETRFTTSQFSSFELLLEAILEKVGAVSSIVIAVAGPSSESFFHLTHLGWKVDIEEVKKRFKIAHFFVLNDLVATGYGIQKLGEKDLSCLYGSTIQKEKISVVICPGTGLGITFGSGNSWTASEGGHIDFAPINEHQLALWKFFQQKYGHVSYERILGGEGFCDLLRYFIGAHTKTPAMITQEVGSDPFCQKAVADYLAILGAYLGNMALLFLPEGGIYLGGGIIPHLSLDPIVDSFLSKGRLSYLLKKISIFSIKNEKCALLGAINYGRIISKKNIHST